MIYGKPKLKTRQQYGLVLSTLFCCLPLGIVAIIHAAKVDGLYRSGDYSSAQEAADNAKKYAQYGLIVGIIVGVIYFFIGMAGSM